MTTSNNDDDQLTEVRMIHGLASGQPFLVVIAQKLVKEVESLGTDKLLVLTVDEPFPSLARVSTDRCNIVKLQLRSVTEKLNTDRRKAKQLGKSISRHTFRECR